MSYHTNNSLSAPRQSKISFFPELARAELLDQGLRLGDQLILSPVSGNRKKMTLNRTCLFFVSKSYEKTLPAGKKIVSVSSLGSDDLFFTLELVYDAKSSLRDDHARFIFRSHTDIPFKVNGVFSFEAFIERGDKVDFSYNFLEFNWGDIHHELSFPGGHSFIEQKLLNSKKYLNSDLTTLITGETGTGKSYLAKKIHKESGRRGDFVHINISSYASGLVESELFGHKKGAFTGSIADHQGAFLRAQNGTLFLDEIDSLSWELQTKLLLFLDSMKIRPVGSNEEVQCQTRLIVASGRPLKDLVEKEKMRVDFYFRLHSGVQIHLEPLRRQKERTELLLKQFEYEHCVVITQRVRGFYLNYAWPGNMRQFYGHLKKKLTLSPGRKIDYDEYDQALLYENLPIISEGELSAALVPLSEIKNTYTRHAYYLLNQKVDFVADQLKITPSTVRGLLKKDQKNMS